MMVAGKLSDLRQSDGVIVDVIGAQGKLAKYNFTLDNLRYFGTLKAMGTTNRTLLRMILLQALMAGAIGYGLGVGAASAWGALLSGRTQIAFRLTWPLLLMSAAAVLFICLTSAALSIRKVIKLEPGVVFRS